VTALWEIYKKNTDKKTFLTVHTDTEEDFINTDTDAYIAIHYWNQPLCRVSRALGKALNTLGKGFAEYHTRQRAHGKKAVGKAAVAECLLSGTRQRLCRVPELDKGRTEKF
jgi:hypothetical protein